MVPASTSRSTIGTCSTAPVVGRDRQEGRIGLRALLAERRQHDRHHLVVGCEHLQQRRVEAARPCSSRWRSRTRRRSRSGRGSARRRALLAAPKLGYSSETGRARAVSGLSRWARIISWFGTLSGTLRSPSMSSEKQSEPGRDRVFGEEAEGGPHHGRAGDLAEGADMRQARRAVAGLEQHRRRRRLARASSRSTIFRASSNGQAFERLRGLDEIGGDGERRRACGRHDGRFLAGRRADPRKARAPPSTQSRGLRTGRGQAIAFRAARLTSQDERRDEQARSSRSPTRRR